MFDNALNLIFLRMFYVTCFKYFNMDGFRTISFATLRNYTLISILQVSITFFQFLSLTKNLESASLDSYCSVCVSETKIRLKPYANLFPRLNLSERYWLIINLSFYYSWIVTIHYCV